MSNVLVSVPAHQPLQADPVRAHGNTPDGITANRHVAAAHRHGDGGDGDGRHRDANGPREFAFICYPLNFNCHSNLMRHTKRLQLAGWQFDHISDHLGSIISRPITAGAAASRGTCALLWRSSGSTRSTCTRHPLLVFFFLWQ